MTAPETIKAFKSYIDQYSTARSEDDDLWINEAITSFIKQRLNIDSQFPNSGFQITQRVRDDLSSVISIDNEMTYSNGKATFNEDYFEIIPDSIGVQNTDIAKTEYKFLYARPRTWAWFYANNGNPFSKPKIKKGRIIYIESDDGINIFPPAQYTKVIVSYIKKWNKFDSVSTETVPIALHWKTHQEITRLAAAKYLISIGNEQGAKNLLQQSAME